jgi:hypothetical protein
MNQRFLAVIAYNSRRQGGKWKKAQETDKYIALWGTIYSTSMYSLHVPLQIHREVIC